MSGHGQHWDLAIGQSVREPQHDGHLSAGNRQGRSRKSAGETAVEGQGSRASARAEHWHVPSLPVRMAWIAAYPQWPAGHPGQGRQWEAGWLLYHLELFERS